MARRTRVLFAAGILLAAVLAARIGLAWLYGMPPHVFLASLIYRDIPRIEVPARLSMVPVTFRARILEKRKYWLNLRVHFEGEAQRAAVSKVVGGPISQPDNGPHPPGEPTTFHIVVRDSRGRTIREQSAQSNGLVDSDMNSVGRRIDEFTLEAGVYDISVVLLSDASGLNAFRTSLELTYHARSTAP